MQTRIVIIGAGSTNFGLGVIADFFKSDVLSGSELVLHDINKIALQKTAEIAQEYKDSLKVDFKITSTTSRQDALKNAKYCLISIEVGKRFELWDQDWKLPMQFGFKQIYGENGGPGGLFHSLRQIPPILEICEDVKKICPEAIIFNFSNPMQRICHAVTTKYPELNFIGLCHEIKSMQRQLPFLMETSYENIEYEAGGLNHLSILLNVKYKDTGKDGYPVIREKFENFYSSLVNDHEGFISTSGAERGVFFELYKLYGFLPITTDSHLGEYISWAYSIADHEGILDFYDNYKRKCLTYYDDDTGYRQFFDLSNELRKEMVSTIIEHIELDSGKTINAVNIPNKGFLDCLPKDIVVEVPAIADKNGLSGIRLESYPETFGTLLNSQTSVIQLTSQAAIKQSKELAHLALLSDPISSDIKSSSALLDTMINSQQEFLGYLV